jgi:DnaJ homolog subfamily C member 17
MSEDWYEILGVKDDATEKEIARGFRLQSLKYHPDKKPGKEAEEKFHLLSKALEVLSSPKLKEEFDKSRRAKVEAINRRKAFDSHRQKLQEELERREQEAGIKQANVYENETKRRVEMLKMEGLRKRKAYEAKESEKTKRKTENDGAHNNMNNIEHSHLDQDNSKKRVRIKLSLPGLSKEELENMFSRFGKVDMIVLLPPKKNFVTAMIEFTSLYGAENCVAEDYTTLAGKEPAFNNIIKAELFSNAKKAKTGRDSPMEKSDDNPASPLDMTDQDYQAATLSRLRNVANQRKNGD